MAQKCGHLSVLAVALSLLAPPAVAAQQITGRVTDQQTGQPMAAVQVFIAGSGVGALTQQNGRYLLLNVSAAALRPPEERTRDARLDHGRHQVHELSHGVGITREHFAQQGGVAIALL